ncbi:protein mono-ADP-ribosyltransferase PARP14-like [Haliotis asinina]|uniref:protein mono-ADP-ribosyltransferase PARP14-like n=1 Tax=Haliotis asinina TaxID=109174 RepID=UPI003532315C
MSSNPMYGLFGASEDEPLLNDEQLGLTTAQFGHSVRGFLMNSVSEDVEDEDILYRKLLVGSDSVFDDDGDNYLTAFGDSVSTVTARRDSEGRTFRSREKRRSLLSFCSVRQKGQAVKSKDKTLQIITSEISDVLSPIDSLSDYESLPDPPSPAYLELVSGDDHILYTIQNLDSNKVKFVKQSHTYIMKLATLAYTKGGEVRWDKGKDDELVVALVKVDHLDSSDSSVPYVQTWRGDMDAVIADVLRDIKVHPVTVMHILWPEMKQKNLSKILPQTSDEVMVSLSDDQPGYIVIGEQDRVLPIVQNLLLLAEQAEEEYILKKYAPEQVRKPPEEVGSVDEQQERKIYEERDKIMFLQRHCSSSIDIIRRELSVIISFDPRSNCIIMCGSKAEEAFSRIKALVADVKMEVYKSKRMGARKYFKSATGETSVGQAEDKYKCFINRDLGRREEEHADDVASADIEVVLKLGDIALTKADVIVNSTNEKLDLSGSELSKAIAKVGGAAIQMECKELYPLGCKVGDVVKTRPGKLHCKELYHCCLSDYTREHPDQAQKLLREIILQCLHKASVAGHSSIAFPPIGTGKRQYPADEVARTFREAIKDFSKSNHCSSLAEVMIVCFHTNQHLMKVFKDAYESEKTNPGHSSLSNISLMTEFHMGHVLLIVKEGNVFREDVDVVVVPTDNKLSVSCDVKWTFVHEFGDNTFRQWKESNIRKSGGVMLRVPGHHCSSILGVSRDFFMGDLFMMICKCLRKADKNKVTSMAIPVMTGNTKGETLPAVLIKSVRCLMGSLEFVRELRLVYTDPAAMVAAVTVFEEQLPSTCVGRYKLAETSPQPPAEGSQTQDETDDSTMQCALAMKIVFSNRRSFGECQQFLDNLLMENLSVETLENPTIGDLTEQQVKDIQRTCADIDVRAEVDTVNCVIHYSGMKVDAIKAKGQTQEVLKNIEFIQKNLEKAELLHRLVEWWYITDDGHEMGFAPMTSMLIEEAFLMRSTNPTTVVQTTTCKVNIDFTSMEISPRESPNHRLQIFRKKGPTVPLPEIWEHMGTKDMIAPRIKDGTEADALRQMFMSSAGNKFEILGVFRIQHKYLYEQYQIQKEAMEKNYPHKSNERQLWHGTNVEAIKNINKYGFNRGYCGKNGTKFGRGVYFATEASYSTNDTLSVPDEAKHKYIYLAQVLTGVPTKGSKKMFDTPLIDRKRSVRYGCTVDNSDNPSMYVVFRDTQAYPKYLFVIRKRKSK